VVTRSTRGIHSGNPGRAGFYRQAALFGRHRGRAHLAERTSGLASSVAPSIMLSRRLTPLETTLVGGMPPGVRQESGTMCRLMPR